MYLCVGCPVEGLLVGPDVVGVFVLGVCVVGQVVVGPDVVGVFVVGVCVVGLFVVGEDVGVSVVGEKDGA